MELSKKCQDIRDAFTWILEQSYPTYGRQKAHSIRLVFGRDIVEEHEPAPNENIVSVTDQSIRFWFRPYSEPGAQRFAASRINSLFDFMQIVIWPRYLNGHCVTDYIESYKLSGQEKVIVDEYKRLIDEQTSGIFGFLGYTTPEYIESSDKSSELLKKIVKLAKKYYAEKFLDFCTSDDMLAINQKLSSLDGSTDNEQYKMDVVSFVEKSIESANYPA